MKKLMILSVMFAVLLLAVSACSKAPAAQAAAPAKTQAATGAAQAATPAATNTAAALPADVYKMGATDMPNPITLKFKIDSEDISIVKSATFEIHNAGTSAIKPVVVFYVGGASDSGMKTFEYDELPAGYKMIKTEEVDMAVSSLYEPNAIKAELDDGLQNNKKLGEDSQNYIAKATSG
ncbi:MAG: hypothetical protein NT001_05595 [Candidatus Woesearchaeota archaeon]|nr:hypothetical protein [Candidatus Woesearchaeota archaeon]